MAARKLIAARVRPTRKSSPTRRLPWRTAFDAFARKNSCDIPPIPRYGSWNPPMALIRVVDRNGTEHEVDASTGLKLMEVLREFDYGVAAICGGMCSCATCHVYVDTEWAQKLPAPMSDERELLAELSHVASESRLSCQIEFTEALAGLKVTIAPDE